jgi:predicted Rossmann fold flavoprotein
MQKNNNVIDIIIIGGGASGMMAGVVASRRSKSVLIIEKNKLLGEKLKITGGGRCNITNAEYDIHKFLEYYGKSKDFLFSPFSMFGVEDTFKFFESLGLPLVIQARKRVFPKTEKAFDVYDALKKELDKNKVSIKSGISVIDFIKINEKIVGVKTTNGSYFAKSFILATGGLSHPETGSTGDGFRFLTDLGHKIEKPNPSVVPLEVSNKWVHSLAGVSLSFMKITFFLDGKKQFSKTGKILFTHFGLSGPLILNSASGVGSLLQAGKVEALIDTYPDTTIGDLEDKIIKVFDNNKNKTLKNVLKEIVPDGTPKAFEILLADSGLLDTKVHSITKDDRKDLVKLLKGLPVHITNLMGYDRAVVVDGGLVLTEVNLKTMQSKIFDNLFITGDLLNINRQSGGFGLQICWTTGYIAGTNA